MRTTNTKWLIEWPFYLLMLNNKERLCSFLKKKRKMGAWESGMSGGLHFDQPGLWTDNRSHGWQSPQAPTPTFYGESEMNCMYNYLGHCRFLVLMVIVEHHHHYHYHYDHLHHSATSLLLPPCHHHYNYRYIVKQPMMNFPQTENRLKKKLFVLVCLVRRCSSLTAPQFGYIYPYMCSSYPISGTVCYLECRHGFQSNGGVNVLQCGNDGKWNQNVSSTLQCKGKSFLWLFRLFKTKQKLNWTMLFF